MVNEDDPTRVDLTEYDPCNFDAMYRLLGTAALSRSTETGTADYSDLPDGFAFALPGTVDPSEVAELFRTVDGAEDWATTESIIQEFADLGDGYRTIEIGVRNTENGRLVGFGALAIDQDGEGEFSDFVVDPAYRGIGIGKAIIDQRLLQARGLGVRRVQVKVLDQTNTLVAHYVLRGFAFNGDGTLVWIER